MSTEISTGTEMISQPNQDFNFMRIRLETEEFISKIKEGLLGGYVFVQEKDGNIEKRFIKTGEPIVNFIGAGAIEKILSMRINPHTVQGNFITKNKISDDFEIMLEKFQQSLGEALIVNKFDWNFRSQNFTWLVFSMRDSVQLFLSRCLDNLERVSYGQTTKAVETNVVGRRGVLGN